MVWRGNLKRCRTMDHSLGSDQVQGGTLPPAKSQRSTVHGSRRGGYEVVSFNWPLIRALPNLPDVHHVRSVDVLLWYQKQMGHSLLCVIG